ncbi:hypothetical protein M9435_005703 [Picochlorum sp. BPE23]|nr:hypothetical protein M9435_005703 [Picochlorum sp. BPE23]
MPPIRHPSYIRRLSPSGHNARIFCCLLNLYRPCPKLTEDFRDAYTNSRFQNILLYVFIIHLQIDVSIVYAFII